MQVTNLFVYGTLRGNIPANDSINGIAVDLGGFPAVVSLEGPPIQGHVLRLSDIELSIYDRYENYPTLYDRVTTITNNGVLVQVYVYNRFIQDWPVRVKWEDIHA